jgi:hypothetical protein
MISAGRSISVVKQVFAWTANNFQNTMVRFLFAVTVGYALVVLAKTWLSVLIVIILLLISLTLLRKIRIGSDMSSVTGLLQRELSREKASGLHLKQSLKPSITTGSIHTDKNQNHEEVHIKKQEVFFASRLEQDGTSTPMLLFTDPITVPSEKALFHARSFLNVVKFGTIPLKKQDGPETEFTLKE